MQFLIVVSHNLGRQRDDKEKEEKKVIAKKKEIHTCKPKDLSSKKMEKQK